MIRKRRICPVLFLYISENEPDCGQESSTGTDTGDTERDDLPGKLQFYLCLMFEMV